MAMSLPDTADEPSFAWDAALKPSGTGLFDIRPPSVPFDAKPIYDADLDCIIGYQREFGGVSRVYSLDGTISVSEKPLESPLIDPLDVLFIVGGIWREGLRGLTEWGMKGVGSSMGRATLFGLRARYYALMQRPLQFATKPLVHMQNPGRYVPVHVLRLAIKYGKRTPDPQGTKGLFMYTYPMMRNGRSYVLEILVRERDYTILHFVFEPVRK
jgi:hypothetical protein